MSAEDTDRRAAAAPLVLMWTAIALAPVAGTLLVLGGGGGLLRAGGALAMLAVVLVALGSVLARAGAGGRASGDVEAYVGDEIEALRADVRADISRAIKASHRALGEQIAALGDTVEALRGQIEVLRSHVERNHLAAPAPVGGPASVTGVAGVAGGMVRHTETVQVTRQTTMLDDTGYGDRTGSVYGSSAATGAVPGQRRGDYADRDAYAGGRRARPEDEPSGGWSSSREVHVGERSSEIRVDDAAAQMRTQDRWASVVQREPEPAAARRGAATTGGRRRRDDGDEDARYWAAFQAENTQGRGERGWGGSEVSRAEAPRHEAARPALPAAPSGEPVLAWVSVRPAAADEPARVPVEPTRYRDTQYRDGSGDAGWSSGGAGYARADGEVSGSIGGYGHAGSGEYGYPRGGEPGRTAGGEFGGADRGRRSGTEYGRTSDTADFGPGGGAVTGRSAGDVGALDRTGTGHAGGSGYGAGSGRGTEDGRGRGEYGGGFGHGGTQYGKPRGGEPGRGGGVEYGHAGGGFGQSGGHYGRAAGQYGSRAGAGYGQAGAEYRQAGAGAEYGRAGAEYGQAGGGEYDAAQGSRYQGYQDDEPTGRRSRHGDRR